MPNAQGGTGRNGQSDWQGMWAPATGPKAPDGPVDAALQKELITYGDLCQFTYANFKLSTVDGKQIGTIKYSPSELLKAPAAQVCIPSCMHPLDALVRTACEKLVYDPAGEGGGQLSCQAVCNGGRQRILLVRHIWHLQGHSGEHSRPLNQLDR
jgi:hypothetical protein